MKFYVNFILRLMFWMLFIYRSSNKLKTIIMKKLIYLLGFLFLLSCSNENLLDSSSELYNEQDYGLFSAVPDNRDKRALQLIEGGHGEGMTYPQFEKLKSVLLDLDDKNVAANYLIEELLCGKLGVKWCLNPGIPPGVSAGFSPTSNTIYFKDEKHITNIIVLHELFHVYQNKKYGGIDDYIKGKKDGHVSLEFEAHIFTSLAFYPNISPIFADHKVEVPFNTYNQGRIVRKSWSDFVFSTHLSSVIDENSYKELLAEFGKRYKPIYGDETSPDLTLRSLIISDLIDKPIFKN